MGSPTTTRLLPLAIAPTASLVGICDASSKMTMSNMPASALRYCATLIGLMSMHGHICGRRSGIFEKRVLSDMPLAVLRTARLRMKSWESLAASWLASGRPAASFATISLRHRFLMSSDTVRNICTEDSKRSPQNVLSSGVSVIIHSARERFMLFSNASLMLSTVILPSSKARATHSSPQFTTLCLPLLYRAYLRSSSTPDNHLEAFCLALSKKPFEKRLPMEKPSMASRADAHLCTPMKVLASTMHLRASRICCSMREVYEVTGSPKRGCPEGIAE